MILKWISFFFGFFVSSILDTSLGEFREWAIAGAGIIVAVSETISKVFYWALAKFSFNRGVNSQYASIKLLSLLNSMKLGVIYGLIVDAFKLGS